MIDKSINKTELTRLAGITTNAMAKLGLNEDVKVPCTGKALYYSRLQSRRYVQRGNSFRPQSLNTALCYPEGVLVLPSALKPHTGVAAVSQRRSKALPPHQFLHLLHIPCIM